MKRLEFRMSKYAQNGVLAGRLDGDTARRKLFAEMSGENAPAIAVLNFAGVQLGTASFLDEAVLRLREDVQGKPIYMIVCDLALAVEEELDALLLRANDAVLAFKHAHGGTYSSPRLLGSLDPKLKEAYERIKQKREASATELYLEARNSEKIGPTAWNNRLNMLASKSLLVEIPMGRTKKYRPMEEMLNGA
jgi:hypothetical protein